MKKKVLFVLQDMPYTLEKKKKIEKKVMWYFPTTYC